MFYLPKKSEQMVSDLFLQESHSLLPTPQPSDSPQELTTVFLTLRHYDLEKVTILSQVKAMIYITSYFRAQGIFQNIRNGHRMFPLHC